MHRAPHRGSGAALSRTGVCGTYGTHEASSFDISNGGRFAKQMVEG